MLGEDVEIRITVQDETNTRIRPDAIIRADPRSAAAAGLVGLVGVQTNQFPRAVDIARPLRAAGHPGLHRRLPRQRLHRDAAGRAAGASAKRWISASRCSPAKRRGGSTICCAPPYRSELQPLYNFMNDLPGLEGAPTPYLPRRRRVAGPAGMRTSFDAGRGCPFLCSFCTIINVQGRKSRARSADDVERLVRANLAQGVHNFFITDDNLARNQNWEAIFDRLITMREEEGLRIHIVAQVDTMAHKIRGFIEKAARAGVNRVFIGLESINPETLKEAQERPEPASPSTARCCRRGTASAR